MSHATRALAATGTRVSCAAIDNERLGFDPLADRAALRTSVVSADTPEDLHHPIPLTADDVETYDPLLPERVRAHRGSASPR